MVPRAAFTQVAGKLKKHVSVPLITSNRINMPHVAEEVLARGDADLVSMDRPMLADPEFMKKAREGREDKINTCIQHLHCLQSGLSRQYLSAETHLVPGQSARLSRNGIELRADDRAQEDCRYRCRSRGLGLCGRGRAAGPQGDLVRGGRRDWRAI